MVLVSLLTLIVFNAPWKLMGMAGEMMLLRPTAMHFTDSDANYWTAQDLGLKLSGLYWEVEYKPNLQIRGHSAYGLTIPRDHTVYVDANLHWSARAAVLAHEAGHVFQPTWVNSVEGDCFAESVAMLVADDKIREHARFLARTRFTCLGVMIAEWPNIYRAAAVLTH